MPATEGGQVDGGNGVEVVVVPVEHFLSSAPSSRSNGRKKTHGAIFLGSLDRKENSFLRRKGHMALFSSSREFLPTSYGRKGATGQLIESPKNPKNLPVAREPSPNHTPCNKSPRFVVGWNWGGVGVVRVKLCEWSEVEVEWRGVEAKQQGRKVRKGRRGKQVCWV